MNAIHCRLIVILLSLLTTTMSYAVTRIEVDTISEIINNPNNSYFVINKTIYVTEDIKLGAECVLCFKDTGRLVGKPKDNGEYPTLTLKNTSVRAWDVCIFDNINIEGEFTNSYVPAEWFGSDEMDDAAMINRALEQAPKHVIRLTRKNYTLSDTIRMNKDGQRLVAAGRLSLVADIPAITMLKQFQQVNVGSIASNGSEWNKFDTYKGTGIKLSGDTYHCDVTVRDLTGLKNGILACYDENKHCCPNQDSQMRPCDSNSATQYTRINFNAINARNGIYIDRINSIKIPYVFTWCTENQFNGGTIRSIRGITSTKTPDSVSIGWHNGNVYRNITFLLDTCERAIDYSNAQQDYFRNISLRGRTPENSKYFEFESCNTVQLTTTSSLPYTRVKADNENFNVILDGCITDNGINRFLGADRIVVFSDGSWGHGKSTRFVTSRIQPYNMVNIIDSIKSDVTLEPQDLLPEVWNRFHIMKKDIVDDIVPSGEPIFIMQGVRMLSGLCYLRPKNGKQITIDISGRRPYFNIPIDIVVDNSEGNVRFKITDTFPPIHSLTKNGIYRLSRNEDLKPELIYMGSGSLF